MVVGVVLDDVVVAMALVLVALLLFLLSSSCFGLRNNIKKQNEGRRAEPPTT